MNSDKCSYLLSIWIMWSHQFCYMLQTIVGITIESISSSHILDSHSNRKYRRNFPDEKNNNKRVPCICISIWNSLHHLIMLTRKVNTGGIFKQIQCYCVNWNEWMIIQIYSHNIQLNGEKMPYSQIEIEILLDLIWYKCIECMLN